MNNINNQDNFIIFQKKKNNQVFHFLISLKKKKISFSMKNDKIIQDFFIELKNEYPFIVKEENIQFFHMDDFLVGNNRFFYNSILL